MNARRFRRRLVLAVALVVAIVGGGLGLRGLGAALVVAEPLKPADAIFVLDGGTPTRELEAAALYRQGYAPRIVVTRARDPIPRARKASGDLPPQEHAVQILRNLGVPETAIVRLTEEVENTLQELTADFAYARAHGIRRAILVTSPNHTRRVRVIWSHRYESTLPAIVRPTSWEPYDTERWWQSRRSLEETIHEALGIVHFMIGSPLPTFERKS